MAGPERKQPTHEDNSAYRAPDLKSAGQLFDHQAIAAFVSYLALSVLIFGRGVLAHPANVYLGQGPDAQQYIWFLAWWAHAISHRLNPLLVRLVWVPSGANLAWATDFPLAACLLYPITRLWGPIVSSNLLHLIAPPLAGWSAFVLCRYIVQRFWPAWFGGFVFAFSPYMLAGMIGSVFLMLVFPLPLAVWATLRRLAGEFNARRYVAILVALLVAQFLMSPEIFASATFLGAIAIALAARQASDEERAPLISVSVRIILAYAISAVPLVPYLYYMFALQIPHGLIFPPLQLCIDLVNFFVPTSLNQLGKLPLFGAVTHRFLNLLAESGGYMGLPLLAIIALFARERWHDRSGRFMVYMLASACVLALGPLLEILGYRLLPLPAAALVVVPLLDKSIPARFMVYAYLALAVIVAMWLAEKREQEVGRTLRWTLGIAIMPFMLPNLSASFWTNAAEVPRFFSDGLYRQYLEPGQTVVVLPFGLYGEGMLWQAVTGMYFRMAGGYVGAAPPMPEEDCGWPIMSGFYRIAGVPEAGDQLKAYLANHDVSAVIVGRRTQYLVTQLNGRQTNGAWLLSSTLDRERIAMGTLLASLHTSPLDIGGITLYRIAPETFATYRHKTALEMQQRAARARFEALLLGGARYLAQGGDPGLLDPARAQRLGLLPQDWFGGPLFTVGDPSLHTRVGLGPAAPNGVVVGVEGSYDALKPLIQKYGADASQVYFPYPAILSPDPVPREPAMMAMMFDRAGLGRAAAVAVRQETDMPPPAPASAADK